MEKNLTIHAMEEYYKTNKLGDLSLTWPNEKRDQIRADLSKLFGLSMGLESINDQMPPEQICPQNIESILVYGSVLFKTLPKITETISHRKYLIFGPKITKTITLPRKLVPNDFDVMVILKEGFSQEKLIIPQRILVNDLPGYGHYEYISPAVERITHYSFDDTCYPLKIGMNLHISYRSVEQFINGIGKGDTVSEKVAEFGIPIVGKDDFEERIRKINFSNRKVLHEILWSLDECENLQGKLV